MCACDYRGIGGELEGGVPGIQLQVMDRAIGEHIQVMHGAT